MADLEDRLEALAQKTRNALEQLTVTFDADVKRLREDALREAVEKMGEDIYSKLNSIQYRLDALENPKPATPKPVVKAPVVVEDTDD
jgi:hypothetical protein